MTRDEADEIIAEREAAERDALARRAAELPSIGIGKPAAFAEGYELARQAALDVFCTDAPITRSVPTEGNQP